MEECHPDVCPCGEHCLNQRFQKCQYCKLKLFYTKHKGFGILADQQIDEGDFVIEYVGEVINQKEFSKRMDRSKGQKNFYIITIGGGKYVDASFKGNLGRFINHSCNPNCRPEIWYILLVWYVSVLRLFYRLVRGQKCVGIFALRKIEPGEELTFDYRFERIGTTKQKCHCGEKNCRGYLGAKAPKPTNTKSNAVTKAKNEKRSTRTSKRVSKKAKPAQKPTRATKSKPTKTKKKPEKKAVKPKQPEKKAVKPKPTPKRKPAPKKQESESSSSGYTSESEESEVEIIIPYENINPARRVLTDSEFSLNSHFTYISEFDIDEIPDQRFIKQQKIFLVRNLRKTNKYLSTLI